MIDGNGFHKTDVIQFKKTYKNKNILYKNMNMLSSLFSDINSPENMFCNSFNEIDNVLAINYPGKTNPDTI